MQALIDRQLKIAFNKLGSCKKILKYKVLDTNYDPVNQTFTRTVESTDFECIVGKFDRKEIDNINIKKDDIKVFVFEDIGFKEGNVVEYEDIEYSIISIVKNNKLIHLQLRNE